MLCWGKEAVRISQRSLIVIITHPTHPLLFRTWTNSAVSRHLCLEPRRATWPRADLQHAWAHDPHCICSSTHWSPSCCKCDSAFPAPLPAPSLALPLCLWAVLGWLCCLPCISLTCAPHVTGPIGGARFLPFLQVSDRASSPSCPVVRAPCAEVKTCSSPKTVGFLPKLLPTFFLLVYFSRSGAPPALSPQATFWCVQGLLYARTRFYLQVLDCSPEDTLCRCCPCPAKQCVIHMHIHLFSMGEEKNLITLGSVNTCLK